MNLPFQNIIVTMKLIQLKILIIGIEDIQSIKFRHNTSHVYDLTALFSQIRIHSNLSLLYLIYLTTKTCLQLSNHAADLRSSLRDQSTWINLLARLITTAAASGFGPGMHITMESPLSYPLSLSLDRSSKILRIQQLFQIVKQRTLNMFFCNILFRHACFLGRNLNLFPSFLFQISIKG